MTGFGEGQSVPRPDGQRTSRERKPSPQLELQGLHEETVQTHSAVDRHASDVTGAVPAQSEPTPLEHCTLRDRVPEPHWLEQPLQSDAIQEHPTVL